MADYNKYFIGFDTASGLISGAEYRANMATSGHIDYFSGVVSGHIYEVSGKLRDYTDQEVANAKLNTQKWLTAVDTIDDLPTEWAEDDGPVPEFKKGWTYLCRVKTEEHADETFQMVPKDDGSVGKWEPYSLNTDWVDHKELATKLGYEQSDKKTVSGYIQDVSDLLESYRQDYRNNIKPGLDLISGQFWGDNDGKTGVSGKVNFIEANKLDKNFAGKGNMLVQDIRLDANGELVKVLIDPTTGDIDGDTYKENITDMLSRVLSGLYPTAVAGEVELRLLIKDGKFSINATPGYTSGLISGDVYYLDEGLELLKNNKLDKEFMKLFDNSGNSKIVQDITIDPATGIAEKRLIDPANPDAPKEYNVNYFSGNVADMLEPFISGKLDKNWFESFDKEGKPDAPDPVMGNMIVQDFTIDPQTGLMEKRLVDPSLPNAKKVYNVNYYSGYATDLLEPFISGKLDKTDLPDLISGKLDKVDLPDLISGKLDKNWFESFNKEGDANLPAISRNMIVQDFTIDPQTGLMEKRLVDPSLPNAKKTYNVNYYSGYVTDLIKEFITSKGGMNTVVMTLMENAIKEYAAGTDRGDGTPYTIDEVFPPGYYFAPYIRRDINGTFSISGNMLPIGTN
jgi:hypothetical protein